MVHVMYIGNRKDLFGQKALSQEDNSKFLIQFDNLNLPESHGWHEYDKKDFITMEDLREKLKK